MAAGLRRAGFDEVRELPLADGGDGTLDALLASRGARAARTASPARSVIPVDAEWATAARWRRGGRDGAGERARARRRSQRPAARVDPRHRRADRRPSCASGARRVIVGVGGSATTDGGLAAVETLGWSSDGIAGHGRVRRVDPLPRRRARVRAAEGRDATHRSRCSPAGSRVSPTQYEQRTGVDVRELAGRRRRRRSRRRSGRDRRRASSPASTWSPTPPASKTRSTTSTWSSPARASSTSPASTGKIVGGVLEWADRRGGAARRGDRRPGHARGARGARGAPGRPGARAHRPGVAGGRGVRACGDAGRGGRARGGAQGAGTRRRVAAQTPSTQMKLPVAAPSRTAFASWYSGEWYQRRAASASGNSSTTNRFGTRSPSSTSDAPHARGSARRTARRRPPPAGGSGRTARRRSRPLRRARRQPCVILAHVRTGDERRANRVARQERRPRAGYPGSQ